MPAPYVDGTSDDDGDDDDDDDGPVVDEDLPATDAAESQTQLDTRAGGMGSPPEATPPPPARMADLFAGVADMPAEPEVVSPVRAAPASPDGTLAPGTRIGHYEIEALLGRGGMGAVYRARHAHMKRLVALKVLKPALARIEVLRARFVREAQAASRFQHPGAVQPYDCGESNGICYLAMELVAGRSLAALLRKETVGLSRAARLFDQILAVLAAAHAGGVVHRDLKPANIMVSEDDVVKVLDFGVARILEPEGEGSSLTAAGDFVGTPAYAAPEQAMGVAVDGRSDLYQIGVMLFEVLAGRVPFLGQNPEAMLLMHVHEDPPLLSSIRPDLPNVRQIDALLTRLLAKKPAQRFASAAESREALRRALGAPAPEAAVWAPALPRPVLLECEGCAELRKIFLFPGTRLAFGRSPEDASREIRDKVILRVLPCRDGQDEENRAATLMISNTHGEIAVEGALATVHDRSSRGLYLDGWLVGRAQSARLSDSFELVLGSGGLALEGRLIRAGAGATTDPIDAVLIRRASNVPEHAYALVARALPIGGGPLDLGASPSPIHARITVGDGAFHVTAGEAAGAPVLRDGAVVLPGTSPALPAGARLELAGATLRAKEVVLADFTTI